jgi:hypothetical protein
MAETTFSPAQIIDRLGGTMKVAAALNLTPSTVSSWKTAKGGIPRWWMRDIEKLAKRQGVSLTQQAAA